jgi:tellurite resistance protein
MARTLDSEHIRRLTDGKTDEGRAEAAAGVAAAVASGELNETERGIALDILAI